MSIVRTFVAVVVLSTVECLAADPVNNAQQALENWAAVYVGGAWVPDYGGSEHMYQWIHGKRFLRYTSRGENCTDGIMGIDPATGEATWWCFYKQGGVAK